MYSKQWWRLEINRVYSLIITILHPRITNQHEAPFNSLMHLTSDNYVISILLCRHTDCVHKKIMGHSGKLCNVNQHLSSLNTDTLLYSYVP